jgi:murein DD-endopeptidase MepM/ murein hydrolase activator NlpD
MHARPPLGSRTARRTALAHLVGTLLLAAATVQHGVWPLDPRPEVVRGFDPPSHPWDAGHRGVDLAGHVGQRVRAALGGRVTFAGRLVGRGVVVVTHGDTRTTYEPVDASVGVGERVRAGAVIGRLQLFASHCFPAACLHWGLIEGSEHYLDPLTLVRAGPVRLLPVGGPPALSARDAPRL